MDRLRIDHHEDCLDPRRRARGVRVGGPGTATALRFSVLRGRLGELLATVLVRLGR